MSLLEEGRPKTEDRSWKTEAGRPKTEDRRNIKLLKTLQVL